MGYQLWILLVLTLGVAETFGQKNVRWSNSTLEQALNRGAQEGKLIFVETYTPVCPPCKVMDKEFLQPDLYKYLNKHFINVKIDMNSVEGQRIKDQYDLVFLPTLMVLFHDGSVKYKVDQIIRAYDLLNRLKLVNEQNIILSDASTISNSPVVKKKNKNKQTPQKAPSIEVDNTSTEIKPDEKILYVMGSDSPDLPPEILKEEAYFKVSLGDGTHLPAAMKYLNTQSNWGTEENIRFIYDFLYNAKGPLFEYFVANRPRFEEVIGKDQVTKSLHILIQERLQRGYPPPTLTEAIELYSIRDGLDGTKLGYLYLLDQQLLARNYAEYATIALEYISNIDSSDHEIMNRAGEQYALCSVLDREATKTHIKNLEKAITLAPDLPSYHQTLSRLYYLLGDKPMALKSLNMARTLANEHGKQFILDTDLRRKIENL